MGVHVIQRFFRSDEATYEAIRNSLNAAWGFPNAGTVTCFQAVSDPGTPRDIEGRVYLSVTDEWCHWPEVAAVLPGLLSAGVVEEVGRDDYIAAMPQVET